VAQVFLEGPQEPGVDEDEGGESGEIVEAVWLLVVGCELLVVCGLLVIGMEQEAVVPPPEPRQFQR
jgi:hypothetical protein